MSYKYNVLAIIRGTTVDGPGFRTSIYLAGCRHACPGCHNQQSWNPDGGEIMTADDILEVVDEEDFDVTLSGGDPLFNPESTKHLVDLLAERGRKVWIYTGFTWERIVADDMLMDAVRNAAVVVDGPFIERLKDPDLPFRGSSNQRLINVAASLSSGKATTIQQNGYP